MLQQRHTNPSRPVRTSQDISLELDCTGNTEYTKISYPVKYGKFHRLTTRDWVMEFNLNFEIRHAKGRTSTWRDPQEWLKRTAGNDWIYYSTGGYAGVYESIGEYYLPNLMYTTNALLGGKPFEDPGVLKLSSGWKDTLTASGLSHAARDMAPRLKEAAEQILCVTPEGLEERARKLFAINGERTTVLPPDARHSDYDVIPLTISDGCLYKCSFCKVKNKKSFTPRSHGDINAQLADLKALYARDLVNYNSLFLGEHDALNTPSDTLIYAARTAFEVLEFAQSVMKTPRLYIFGSADALLNAEESLFQRLNALPYLTYINIGLESADDETLARIGKPITAAKVQKAFMRMQEINREFDRIEMTCNFIMDEKLPEGHYKSMMALVREGFRFTQPKGSVYLSPLRFGRPSREILFDFYHLKRLSRLPMTLYIIQRL